MLSKAQRGVGTDVNTTAWQCTHLAKRSGDAVNLGRRALARFVFPCTSVELDVE